MDAEFNRVSADDIEKLGLKDRGQATIHCADCSCELMVFQITKNNKDLVADDINPIATRIMVHCGMCGGSSYIRTLEGQFYPGAPKDNMGFEPIECENSDTCDVCFRAWTN